MNIKSGKPFAMLSATDASTLLIGRGRRILDSVKIGENCIHAVILRRNGDIEDLGQTHNTLITSSGGGRDMIAGASGGVLPAGGQNSPSVTTVTATTLQGTGSVWTTNQLAGMRIVVPVTGITTRPVYGNIISNTANVVTVDGWWDLSTDTIGTTPAVGNAFVILPGYGCGRWMALSQDTTAPVAGDTNLVGEITTNGAARSLATYAHTLATATYTLQKAFAITGTFAAIHKMAIFLVGTGTAGPMLFAGNLNADASVVNGDTLTVTDTITIS